MVRSRTPDATPALLHGLPSDLAHGIHGRELCYRHFLGGLIEYLSERIGSTLREYGRQARTIGLRIRYVDHFSAHQNVRLISSVLRRANAQTQLEDIPLEVEAGVSVTVGKPPRG